MKNLTYAIGLVAILFGQGVQANTLILPSFSSEPSLIGTGGILDTKFGLGNLQRIDDNLDQNWYVTANQVSVTAVAKYAGYSQNFGFIDASNNFNSLLYVPYMNNQSNTFNVGASGTPFRFGLDPSGSPLFSSDPSENVACIWFLCTPAMDHMVSWLVTGDGQYAGDYVLAWEDLKFLGDRDYNDLVVRVSGVSNMPAVPVPAAAWLFASGLMALLTVSRRRRV